MANFIVMELAAHPIHSDQWFWTGRSFVATSTGATVDQLTKSHFSVRNLKRQCDEEWDSWEAIEILPFPDAKTVPTVIRDDFPQTDKRVKELLEVKFGVGCLDTL